MEINDKVIIVTGGASGIGRAMAERFVREGARAVVISDLNGDGARQVAEKIGAYPVQTDVASEAQVVALIRDAEARFGPVDLFCANAGIGAGEGLDASDAEWELSWKVNVMAHVYAARHLVPRMVERGQGYFLHTASAAGLLSQFEAPYAVTKHAVVAFAEWLSITYGDKGVRVSCLCPMGVDTPMLRSAPPAKRERMAADRMMSPEAVADVVVQGLQEERFLILPHPEVLDFWRGRSADHERWLRGMRRFHAVAMEN
ncbi:MAG: SDR family oxidoreductase [Ectothiorhodospiraceae bacterium]|nr:SDR family oxidoreductase [Ectothiorhodospiraceae bacterium]